MKFWIVTPSFNQVHWLPYCIASVRDQAASAALAIHHHVQDACSSDGTVEYLNRHATQVQREETPRYSFSFASEPDQGMYDAINRGIHRADADTDIICHLNCDEQYLEGALGRVADYAKQHPAIEIILADGIVVDADGAYVCSRQVLKPLLYHSVLCALNTLTAATFIRSHVIRKYNAYHDSTWKAAGDVVWMLNLMQQGCHLGVLRSYTSTFADTGDNLALTQVWRDEFLRLRQFVPAWAAHVSWLWLAHHRMRRLWNGLYQVAPLEYGIYTKDSPTQRQPFKVDHPTAIWRSRLRLAASVQRS